MIKREFQDKGEADLHIKLINKCLSGNYNCKYCKKLK